MVHSEQEQQVERWGMLELACPGPAAGNPFADCELFADFRHGGRTVRVRGFYDGGGVYKLRFMPDAVGEWSFVTRSSSPELDGIAGSFRCTQPSPGNRGPVRVRDEYRFAYEDGTPYVPVGTTCYAWTHQSEALQRQTLDTLRSAPFNKIRMCLFPKKYSFNSVEPDLFPFSGNREAGFDWSRFNPAYFSRLEERLRELQELGIEADLILFHPYDKGHWGFDAMDSEADDRYVRYVVSRLAAFRNVWWSLANEYDFMKAKTMSDWDRLFRLVQQEDPYGHLRSIHNGTGMYDPESVVMYDHAKPWVTHCSIQHWDVNLTPVWHRLYRKPIVIDECCYEGNVPQRWGNITAEEMTRRFWDAAARGGYAGHGETYLHPEDEIWWAKGGRLYGDSPARIAFLRRVLEAAPEGCRPIPAFRDVPTIGVPGEYYLLYFGIHRPAYRMIELPPDVSFQAEILDTWEMTATPLEGRLTGSCRIELPGKPYLALRIYRSEA
ncbi:DUF5605 domain-containing protein [Paenibacillus ginsengihumi]|uniref:DUF5605 domain-containing protein n=1 Tax=Paenibacillus ginsengihumi TaxID=431596 RepID=UPI000381EEA2|nr:DUF5605 domain-containing protein [Paenibacillus ginsengihumi]